jgi:hypothetical protein
MDPRISTLESDVAAARASVEAIQSNYATNLQLAEVQAYLKLEIVRNRERLDHKIDAMSGAMKLEYTQSNADMKMEFNKSNAELRVAVRNWVLATVVGLFVAFGGMAYMMYNIATRAV